MDDRETRLSHALADLSRTLREAMRHTLAEAGVTYPEWQLLAYLYRRIHPDAVDMPHGHEPPEGLPGLTGLLDALHERGYVKYLRRTGLDSAVLTREGSRLVRALAALNSDTIGRAISGLTVDEVDALIAAVERMGTALRDESPVEA